LFSRILLEIGRLENQRTTANALELRGFQVDLSVKTTVKHTAIFAGAFEKPANLGRVFDRTRVKTP
jgi:hypothetical protein